ncbi:MAG: hypothetical protein M3Y87_28670, partial [Myxococcota bacterium]|nr:hypothetical protein [Myxococcota bacterium]
MLASRGIEPFLLAVGCVSVLACGEPGVVPDGGADAGPPPMCDEPTPFETGDADGHAEPLAAAAGQARAGRIEEAELPADRTGLAVWSAGDFVLANERIAVLIEDAGPSDLYDPYGGRIVGVASREDDTLVAADFNEILFGLGAFLVATERVTVISDGSDGGAAVVRATGPLARIDFTGDLLTSIVPGDFEGWPAAIDYRLEPGADRVTVTLRAIETGARNTRVPMILQAFFQGSRMPMWNPVGGFSALSEATPYIAFDDPTGGAAYAWEAPEGRPLRQVIDQSGVLVTQIGPLPVMPCETLEVPIGSLVVARTFDATQAIARTAAGESLRTITGTVLEADGSPATDVRVHVTSGEAHLTRARADASGAATIQIPDADVEVWGYRGGTAMVGPIAMPRGTGTFAITMPALGTIEVEAHDAASGDVVPARVQAFA